MLNFICGRSGSGKTQRIIEMIKDRVLQNKRTYLLVPEQQAFISESMLSVLPASSALCFEVISFSRLADIVFSQYGGITDSVGGKGERDVIMWQTLREISSFLKEYGNVKTDPALSSMMLSTIDELHANGITPEECEVAAEKCENERLAGKLHDVALIYANFHRLLSDRLGEGALAAENKLSRLLSLLREHDYFKGSHIFVDSFTSFTGEERGILFALAGVADELTVTFCRDADSRGMPHTVSIDDTYRHFLRFAKENGIEYNAVTLGKNGSDKDEALSLLESGLWDFSLTKDSVKKLPKEKLSSIEAYKCKNEHEEINLVALKILNEYRRGVKFSEMAVVLRDAESRKGLIEAVFSQMGIPYFLSERTDISSTAAARLVFSALRCIIYNFRTSDLLTLLKTGLCGINDAESDLFEDYVYTWSISGAKFLEDVWSMNPDGYSADKPVGRSKDILLAANSVREKLVPPLVRLRDKMAAAKGNAVESCRALYDYLAEISLSSSLSELAMLDLAMGDTRSAGEDIRIYDVIVSSLSRLATLLDDITVTPEELLYAIEIMLRGGD